MSQTFGALAWERVSKDHEHKHIKQISFELLPVSFHYCYSILVDRNYDRTESNSDKPPRGKSLFAAITFHAMVNVSELVLFPIYGSYYDPVIAFIITAVTAVIVTFLWGPKTLARYRYA